MKEYYCVPFAPESNCTKDEAIELLKTTEKPILRTCGFRWKNPTTLKVKSTYDECMEALDWCSAWQLVEFEDHIELDYYSGNDML